MKNDQNIDIATKVKHTGLTDKESLVYAAILSLGGAFPSRVATMTGIKRSTAYKVLLDLSIKGLISGIEKRNKLFYQAEKPERLVRYVKDRVRMAENDLEKAEKALPELSQLFAMSGQKPKVTFYEGPDSIKIICDDMVSGKKSYEMCSFSNAAKFKDTIDQSVLRDFVQSKERLGITLRAIVPDTPNDRGYNDAVFKGIKKEIWPQIRFVSPETFNFDAELTVYSTNKVSITKLGGDQVIGVIIEDLVIHQMISMIFELAWKTAK